MIACPDKELLIDFLFKVDQLFPIPISSKTDLFQYANKLILNGTCAIELCDGKIVSLVAGYTNDIDNGLAYISMVATLPEMMGHGYASKLIHEFNCRAKENNMKAVHLYSHVKNRKAIQMYKTIGFSEWLIDNEARPEDVHLIIKL